MDRASASSWSPPWSPHVLFVALYSGDSFVPTAVRAARHLNISSAPSSPQFHAVVNKLSPPLPTWFRQWPISDMPRDAQQEHKNLSRGKPHGATVFLWKPLLYRLVLLDKVIVLDLDIVMLDSVGISRLWAEFDSFGPNQVLGIASEQGPTYFRYGRHAGVNGGVQLQYLARMRQRAVGVDGAVADGTYDEALRLCAAGGCKQWDQVEPSLGDQTLYTRLCLLRPHLCHRLPCGWNRQMSTKFYSVGNFRTDWHACDSPCSLLHFNQPLLEGVVPILQTTDTRLSCAECRSGMKTLANRTRSRSSKNPKFAWGASKVYMAEVIDKCCCSG